MHQPVLLREILRELVQSAPSKVYVDGTTGDGGHAEAILEASAPSGKLLAVDRDRNAIAEAKRRLSRFAGRVVLVQGNFKELNEILKHHRIDKAAGVILDLGLSSSQIEDPRRGFSFRLDGPLDMRQDQQQPQTAADLVNFLPPTDLEKIIRTYGEERWSKRIACAIAEARKKSPITSTLQLAEIIRRAIPAKFHPPKTNPATRSFQALRIAVNDELDGLGGAVRQIIFCLEQGGRVGIISYHSLEDRIIKQTLRSLSGQCICPPEIPICSCGQKPQVKIITSKPIVPSIEEIGRNPRARSAKLRVAERCAE